VLTESPIRSRRPLQHHARFRHGRGDYVGVIRLLRDTLVKQVASGTPRIKRRLHRGRCDSKVEETQRRLESLQLSDHVDSQRSGVRERTGVLPHLPIFEADGPGRGGAFELGNEGAPDIVLLYRSEPPGNKTAQSG